MIRLFLNGLAASAGGGLTYLRNVVPELSSRGEIETILAVPPLLRKEFSGQPNVSFVEIEDGGGALRRFWREQRQLPQIVGHSGADVLISAGNMALRRSPVPQILLSRNSLYTTPDFYADLRRRREYALWLDASIKGILAKKSIYWADRTVAPSAAFANDLTRWTGRKVEVIHHGFDRESFFGDPAPLPPSIQPKLDACKGCLRLLFVSHYNYYRNFETLFKALPILQRAMPGRQVKLLLTCTLRSEDNPGSYRAEGAAELVQSLGISENIVELGSVPYTLLHHLYGSADIYVTPAYAETFAHPLVEAMSSGLPVVASDLPVHREICDDAAAHFPCFSPEELAAQVLRVASSQPLAGEMSRKGKLRALEFSWSRHVDQMVSLATELCRGRRDVPSAAS